MRGASVSQVVAEVIDAIEAGYANIWGRLIQLAMAIRRHPW